MNLESDVIEEFVRRWEARKSEVRAAFEASHPSDYIDIVRHVVSILTTDGYSGSPDPKRLHEINDGDYQGTLVYVIAETGYQPNTYWYVRVCYGSCSGCDTLEAIRGYCSELPSKEQVDQYMTLALHILQGLKKMGGEEV